MICQQTDPPCDPQDHEMHRIARILALGGERDAETADLRELARWCNEIADFRERGPSDNTF